MKKVYFKASGDASSTLNVRDYAKLLNDVLDSPVLDDNNFEFKWGNYPYNFCLQGELCNMKELFLVRGFVECDEQGNIIQRCVGCEIDGDFELTSKEQAEEFVRDWNNLIQKYGSKYASNISWANNKVGGLYEGPFDKNNIPTNW